jgi:hypothetical protein
VGVTASTARQQWNKDNYKQVKIWTKPEIADAFKAKCLAEGVSMAQSISNYMCGRSQSNLPAQPAPLKVETRSQRRKAMKNAISHIEAILAAEQEYMNRIPANLQASTRYDDADRTVSALEDALETLYDAY